MAKTLKYQDIISIVSKPLPSNITDNYQGLACNMATNLIWSMYDWRESIKTLPPFYLVPNEQDILPPTGAIPSDFLGLRKVSLCQYAAGPNGGTTMMDMKIVKDLQLTIVRGLPGSISYEPETQGFRVFPRTPENIGSPYYFITGTYKKRPTLITNATMSTVFPFDDQYLPTFVACFRWAFYALAGNDKAGAAQEANGNTYYTGELSNAVAGIMQMASDQGLNDGDVFVAPTTGLIGGFGPGYPGMAGINGIYWG